MLCLLTISFWDFLKKKKKIIKWHQKYLCHNYRLKSNLTCPSDDKWSVFCVNISTFCFWPRKCSQLGGESRSGFHPDFHDVFKIIYLKITFLAHLSLILHSGLFLCTAFVFSASLQNFYLVLWPQMFFFSFFLFFNS